MSLRTFRSLAPATCAVLPSTPPPGPFHSKRHLFGDESLHGIRHVGEPGAAAHFAVRKDVETDGALLFERGQDGAILLRPQFLDRNLSRGVRGPGCQQFGRTQETADLFGAKTIGHRSAL